MSGADELTWEEASAVCEQVVERVEEAAVVDRRILAAVLATIISRGHVLLEDVPGTGKSVTARVFAEALGLDFRRIQFTPDLLPADITGSNVYNEHDREFEFSEGPVFTNVVLADEINRAPPKTQAALLEAMEERQVSIDGQTHDLPEPFLVIATQNPVEQEGTFRLPEAQRDRFNVKASLGYPDVDGEMGLLERRSNRRSLSPSVETATDPETVVGMQELAEDVRVDEKVRRYIVDLARQTREDPRTEIGVSPRGVQRVYELSRAVAVVAGREYVVPDDVKRMANLTMAHRLVLTTEASVEGVDPNAVVQRALDAVDVPAIAPDPGEPEGATEPADGVMPVGSDTETDEGDGGSERTARDDRTDGTPAPDASEAGQRRQRGQETERGQPNGSHGNSEPAGDGHTTSDRDVPRDGRRRQDSRSETDDDEQSREQ